MAGLLRCQAFCTTDLLDATFQRKGVAWATRKVHCIPVVDEGLVRRAEQFRDGQLQISESAPRQIFRVVLGFYIDHL